MRWKFSFCLVVLVMLFSLNVFADYSCVGENETNLPQSTLCRRWFLNEYGCHEYTNLPSSTICGTDYYEYGCQEGTSLGSDLYERYHEFKCNGIGNCVDNVGSWQVYQYCTDDAYCYSGSFGSIYCRNSTKENVCPNLNPISDVTAREDDLIKIKAPAIDIDNDTLYYSYSRPFNSSGLWKTTYVDSGNYTIQVNVSDGLCLDSGFFRLEILDVDRNITPINITPSNQTNKTNETTALKCFIKSNTQQFPIKIVSVNVDKFEIYKKNESFRSELGQDFIVKIKFIPQKNLTDLQIEGFINVDDYYETGNLTDITETFDANKAVIYSRELYFKIPDEMFSGYYPLRLLFYDSSGIYDSCDYRLKVEEPETCIVINDMEMIPEIIKAGRVLIVEGEIKNLCNTTIDNIKVIASALGSSDSEIINNLTRWKTKEIEDLILRIPVCTERGDYTAKLAVSYDEGTKKISKAETFSILANSDCKEAENIDELVVSPSADNVYQEGIETVYNIVVTNSGERTKTYILNIEGVDVFGDYRLEPGSVLLIPEKKSQTAYLYLSAEQSDIIGPKPVLITLESDTVQKKETVTANIIKSNKKTFFSELWDSFSAFWNKIRSSFLYSLLLVFLAVIVFFFVMFLLFFKSDDDEKKKRKRERYY